MHDAASITGAQVAPAGRLHREAAGLEARGMGEVGRVEVGGAQRGDARRRTRRYDDVVLSGAAAGGQTRSAFSWRCMGSFDFALRLDFAHRLPCSVHDGDVLRVQLRRHVLADGFLHVLDAHPIAQRRQRAEEHRVRNRSAQNGRRDAVASSAAMRSSSNIRTLFTSTTHRGFSSVSQPSPQQRLSSR